jgi:hypothetical protein
MNNYFHGVCESWVSLNYAVVVDAQRISCVSLVLFYNARAPRNPSRSWDQLTAKMKKKLDGDIKNCCHAVLMELFGASARSCKQMLLNEVRLQNGLCVASSRGAVLGAATTPREWKLSTKNVTLEMSQKGYFA